MIHRVYTDVELLRCVSIFPDRVQQPLDAWAFLEDEKNILLSDGRDNFSLMHRTDDPHVFEGHVFFSNAKGKEALKLARKMILHLILSEGLLKMFTVIPEDNKKSRWFVRQLGFKQTSDDEFTLEVKDLK